MSQRNARIYSLDTVGARIEREIRREKERRVTQRDTSSLNTITTPKLKTHIFPIIQPYYTSILATEKGRQAAIVIVRVLVAIVIGRVLVVAIVIGRVLVAIVIGRVLVAIVIGRVLVAIVIG